MGLDFIRKLDLQKVKYDFYIDGALYLDVILSMLSNNFHPEENFLVKQGLIVNLRRKADVGVY